jgi:hypothetical protein
MLINYYTAFIQVIAAFYFSLCFEQLFDKYFWNKQHKERLQGIIGKVEHNFNLNKEEKEEINVAFKERQRDSLNKTRIISSVLFLFSILVLIYSGIEQSCQINLPICASIIILSLITLPALFIFLEGLIKTNWYAKGVESKITLESSQLNQDITAAINNDTNNAAYNRYVAQILTNTTDGDTISKTDILSKVIEKFKKQSVSNIKRYICKKYIF